MTAAELREDLGKQLTNKNKKFDPTEENWCSVPFISLYTDNIYTYSAKDTGEKDDDGNMKFTFGEGWTK